MKTLCLCVFVFHLILRRGERLPGKRIRQQPNAQLLADFLWLGDSDSNRE